MSSLATQLAARNTLDSSRLSTSQSLKHPPSFIYSPRHAASISTSDLHHIASNAYDQLISIDPFFERYQQKLFGEEAKRTDRGALTKEENDKLDLVLEKVMRAMGKHMLLKPAGIVLEWLVRRFRVNDLNIASLLSLFLPYHTTPHFPSALTLIPEATLLTTPFSCLIPTRLSLSPLPLPSLIGFLPPFSSVPTARPFLDFILALPMSYLRHEEIVHRPMISLWLQVVASYLERAGSKLPDGERAAVLSTILEVLQASRSQPDCLIACYILLARYSLHHPMDGETLKVVLKTIVGNSAGKNVKDVETDKAMITALVVVSQLGEGELEVKEGKKFLGGSGWKALMRVENLDELLIDLCNQYDATRFMSAFLRALCQESLFPTNTTSLTLLKSLLTPRPSTILPTQIVALLASSSLSSLLSSPIDESSTGLIKVLNQLYQRWPEVWEAETKSRTTSFATGEETGSNEQLWKIMNLVLGAGLDLSTSTSSAIVLSNSSPDASVRIVALKELLAAKELQIANPTFLHDSLLARLSEPNSSILAAVLESQTLEIVHEALSAEEIFNTLLVVLSTPKLSDEIYSIVLPYLSGPFLVAHPEKIEEVVKAFFWERILSRKGESKERVAVAQALSVGPITTYSWISGVGALLHISDVEPTLDAAVATNAAVVRTISSNIVKLEENAQSAALDFLLATSSNSDDDKSSVLSLLVLIQLSSALSPSLRIPLASRIFETLQIGQISLDTLTGAQPESLLDKTLPAGPVLSTLLGQAILTRQKAPKTLRRIRAALLSSTVASLRAGEGFAWSWLEGGNEKSGEYKGLGKKVYAIAHTGTTAGAADFARDLLSSLFTTLAGADAVAFLASVWTDQSTDEGLKICALRDAKVFVEVQSKKEVKGNVDFQTVVPSVLVALIDGGKKVREEAVGVLEAVVKGMPEKVGEVYGRGEFYGKSTSAAIKYLDVVDATKYLQLLLSSRVELIMDGSFLTTLHTTSLDSDSSSSKKKSASLKLKAYTFLLSHATAWTDVFARTHILRSLQGIRDGPKTVLVVDILAEVVKNPVGAKVEKEVVEEYARLLLQPFEGATRKWLEADDAKALGVFFSALAVTDRAGSGAMIRKEALSVVRTSLFATVRGETRLDLFKRLVRLATTAESAVTPNVLLTLRACKPDVETVTSFLNEVKLSVATPVAKGAKRGRTSLDSVSSRSERLPELIVALEAVDFTNVAASHGLLLALFDLLSSLIEISAAAQLDIQYLGQLILTTLSKVIENVQPSSGVTNDSIRMAPVLDFMRSSANPQTSHQALLLLAQLGPLVPDQLVHNIMPIFTFMGANVLQRDDAYSLRVVEQTLESILPSLVKAMKKSTANRDTLVSGKLPFIDLFRFSPYAVHLADLKDLLRVFTDAASHVPRHRRLKLFVRFVETLGSKEFLSAVSMLLLESASPSADATELPLSVFENFSVDVQLFALKQVVEEVSRSLLRLAGDVVQAPFLSLTLDGENSDPKEQILSLINFLALALEAKQLASKVDAARAAGLLDIDTTLSELVRSLLDLSSLPMESYKPSESADFASSTSYSVQAAVRLMSTQAFSEAVLWLLDLADPVVQASALLLLRTRLPTIKPARRGDISPAVVTVVDRLRASLTDKEVDLDLTLSTMDVIAASIYPDEDSVLAKTVPDLIAVSTSSETSKSAQLSSLEIIRKLANRLGPRLIPLVAKIIPCTVSMLRREATDVANASEAIVTTSFQILEGIFMSIPTFVGSHLDKVFDASLSSDILSLTADKDSAAAKARTLLLSTAAKKLPAKTLYPAVIRLHASLDGTDKEPILGLLDLLNRALRQGKTADIADNYRPIFKLFLTIFDLRRVHSDALSLDDISQIEENALGAFVQFILKLNEQTFRPLFLRTYDWAVIDLADEENSITALAARRTVLYKLLDKLLVQLKSIVVPYYSFMLDQTIELYESFARGDIVDSSLWTAVTSSLTKALEFDESGFWTPLRLSKLTKPIASQLLSPTPLPTSLLTSLYHPLVAAFAQSLLPHEDLLKAYNTAFLMLTRSDDLRTKRGALEALEQIWMELGDGMLGLVPETTPFLAETMEEVEGGVESTTRRLVARIEEHLGESLDSFLEN
ncbi:U3 small nucleolar RNA-associated protein 10, partial [Phenoliferia sp. Uapishka_3]